MDEACPAVKVPVAWQADRVIELIDAAAGGDAPFFIRWDPPEPHLPCKPSREYFEKYAVESIEPWPSFADTQEGKPEVQKRQKRIWGIEDWGWEKWAPVVARYFGVISEIDTQIGRLLAKLEEHGIEENTLVIYSTDHGDYCGGHGQIDKHFNLYDDVVRVPLFVRWPGKVEAGQVYDGFVAHELDIAKTILEAAGIDAPESFAGKNLIPMLKGSESAREDIFSQYFGGETGLYSMRMVRDRRYKYIYNPTSIDEFYDLEKDPGELVNAIDDPDYATGIARLKSRMWEWGKAINDRLFMFWNEPHFHPEAKSAAEKAGL